MYFYEVQANALPISCRECKDMEYSLTLSLTLALNGGGWLMPRPICFTSRMTQYPLYRRLDGCGKFLPPTDFDPRTLQPVASHYTD